MKRQELSGARQVLRQVETVIQGKREVVRKVFLAMLAGGHILIEDVPGTGKTTLALAFSRALSLEFGRIQFTPDVLPSDVTGFTMYQQQTGKFVFKRGAAFCNLLLADEINRASPKTQSALLEVMEEGQITVDGVSHPLPQPHIVIATQNPAGSGGTHPRPESQMDRFLMRISIGYPDMDSEIEMLRQRRTAAPLEVVEPVLDAGGLLALRQAVTQVEIHPSIYRYTVKLAAATRDHPDIAVGVSPRGTLALTRVAQAVAMAAGRSFVLPDDVDLCFLDVCAHRVSLQPRAAAQGKTAEQVLQGVLQEVPTPAVAAAQ